MTQSVLEKTQVQKTDLQILKMDPRVGTPKYESTGSAGFDLRAFLDREHAESTGLQVEEIEENGEKFFAYNLKAGTRAKLPTAMKFVIPEGFEVQIRPRSGLAFKKGISLTNTPGTIDSDYRGEVQILIINHGDEDFLIKDGERIAQAVIAPVWQANFLEINELPEEADNTRGAGGFGSTGTK